MQRWETLTRFPVDRLHKSQTLRPPPGRGGIPRDFYARYFYRFIHRDTPTPWSNEDLVVVELRIFVARERDEGLPGWSIVSASLADFEIFKNEPTVDEAEETEKEGEDCFSNDTEILL